MASQSNPYEDLEHLLFKGFVKDTLHFNGFDLVLKSLSEHELERVNSRTPSKSRTKTNIYDCWYVAYSLLEVDGVCLLEDREATTLKLFKALRKWPQKAVARVVHKCLTFSKRISDAYKKFEAYCYEPQSRAYWKAYQNLPLNSFTVTGVLGSECLPLSPVQIQWVNFNRSEDDKQVFDVQWSYVRWVGAFLNGKAAEKIDNEVKQQKDKEDDYRAEVIARARGLSDSQDQLYSPYSPESRDKELEKLLYDLDVTINDKKDAHALAMDATRANAIEEYREFRRKERERKIEAINNQAAMAPADGPLPFDIFDQKSMVDIEDMSRRRDLITSVLGIPAAELDAIDKEFEVPAELLQKFAPLTNSTKSTILPVNTELGNFSGEFFRDPRNPFSR